MRCRSLYQTVYLSSLLFSLNTCASKPSPPYNSSLPNHISVSDSILPPDSEIKAPLLIPPTPIIQITPQYAASPLLQNVLELDQTATPTIPNFKLEVELETEQNTNNLSLEELVQTYNTAYQQEINQIGINKKIVIYKQQHLLEIYLNNHKLKSYSISLGDFIGDKEIRGDNKTPEGTFYIAQKNPESKFYKALLLNHPTLEAAKRGKNEGLINQSEYESIKKAEENCQTPPQNTSLGSYIEIHGGSDQRENQDWTWGCIALNNVEIDEIYKFAEQGCSNGQKKTIVEIKL